MRLSSDELRICRKCNSKVNMEGEAETECPHCGTRVWFYQYRTLPEPSPLPPESPNQFWSDKVSISLMVTLAVWSIIALTQFQKGHVIATMSTLASLGFGGFAFFRHRETMEHERQMLDQTKLLEYANVQFQRVRELTLRYHHLLKTGDTRIEQYFEEIYTKAELLRSAASRDRSAIADVEDRICNIAEKLVEDHRKWSTQKLRADPENYQRRKADLKKTFDFVENVGYVLPSEIRKAALDKLKSDYKQVVYEQKLKEEERAIKRQLQEEAKREKELRDAQVAAELKEREIKNRLDEALKQQLDVHSNEIQELQRMLAEAEANSQRTMSMAQLTKAGHVYILSNLGSFGENIFKVGMTRRLEPEMRVKELGDASVPFPFDVHAMIYCENAPDLEKKLHHELTRYRVNRVNLRKEYFHVDLNSILSAVKSHHGKIEYVAEPEALEIRETQEISPDDLVQLEEDFSELGINFEEEED